MLEILNDILNKKIWILQKFRDQALVNDKTFFEKNQGPINFILGHFFKNLLNENHGLLAHF